MPVRMHNTPLVPESFNISIAVKIALVASRRIRSEGEVILESEVVI